MCFPSVGMMVEKCTADEYPAQFSLMTLNAQLLMDKKWIVNVFQMLEQSKNPGDFHLSVFFCVQQ